MTKQQRTFKDKLLALAKRLFWRPIKFYSLVLAGAAIPLLLLYQTVSVDILARETRDLEVKRDKLKNEVDHIQVEIDQLTNIDRIEKLAREKYGLTGSSDEVERIVINEYSHDDVQLAEDKQADNKKQVTHAGVN